jgi:nucleoside-diphosphate-sugar epimerase
MRILIIGGTRFIGREVVRQLCELGHELLLFNRGNSKEPLPDGVIQIQGDRKKLSEYQDSFRKFAPQLVLDMIPFTESQAEDSVNCFRGIAQRTVTISSQDVYRAWGRLLGSEPGYPDPLPLTEDAPLREKLFPYRKHAANAEDMMYHYDKILVEKAYQSDLELPTTILRLPMVYGPNDAQHRLFEQLKRMDDRRSVILLSEKMSTWRWTRGYVDNVAAAIVAAVTDDIATGKTYNVGESVTISMEQWIEAVGKVAGWSGKIVVLPEEKLPAHLRTEINSSQSLVTDCSRLREELRFTDNVSLEEALRQTIDWQRDNSPTEYDSKMFDYAAEDKALS